MDVGAFRRVTGYDEREDPLWVVRAIADAAMARAHRTASVSVWKPIKDAPKDRRLLLCNDDWVVCGRWMDGKYQQGWRLDTGDIGEPRWFAEITKP